MGYNFDLEKMTIKELRALLDPAQPQDEGDATLAKAAGMTVDEIQSLSFPKYRQFTKAFWKAVHNYQPPPDDEQKN